MTWAWMFPLEKFIEAAIENDCSIIYCSALLITTMPVMGEVVEKAVEAGVRDKVKIMIGGAPVTEAFGQSINADAYTPDATTCAEVAMQLLASWESSFFPACAADRLRLRR